MAKRVEKEAVELIKEEQPKEVGTKIIEECHKPPSFFFGHNQDTSGQNTCTTREYVEGKNLTLPLNLNDAYIRFLTYLPYTSGATLRPLLPIPRKVEGKKGELEHYISIGLFNYKPANQMLL